MHARRQQEHVVQHDTNTHARTHTRDTDFMDRQQTHGGLAYRGTQAARRRHIGLVAGTDTEALQTVGQVI